MNRKIVLSLAVIVTVSLSAGAQEAPIANQAAPSSKATDAAPAATISIEDANTALTAARAANKDKRYADAEALMLHLTSKKPELIYPWLELGLAQLGLKKYPEAENSFTVAIGIDPASKKAIHSVNYYQQPDTPGAVAPYATRASRIQGAGVTVFKQERKPEVNGIGYSSLGEIYIRTNRIPEAQAAFDEAVKADPAQAGLYYGNETVFFFQTGNAPAQLDAAIKAIAADPTRARNYYFKAQALATQATVDPKTSKLILPPGCLEAYQKYLELDPNGQFAADARSIIASAGAPFKAVFKK
jgi:tetratricopeptide (TPR) repeat protein